MIWWMWVQKTCKFKEYVFACVLTCSLVIPALQSCAGIFIGITLGISSNRSTVTALMIALFFHQGNEGLALGVLMVKAKYSALKYFLLAAAFVVVTPLGVGIGIGVSNNYNGESHAALASEGIFDSISAGILIYNGLCDLIIPTFADDELPKSWVLRAVGFGSLYTGAAIMALIGKWAWSKSFENGDSMFILFCHFLKFWKASWIWWPCNGQGSFLGDHIAELFFPRAMVMVF